MVGGHLSVDLYSYFSVVERQYDAEEAARHSIFQKLNFDAVTKIIRDHEIDCEFKWGDGGYDVFLTQEEFDLAKRELEGMASAGGYVSSMKILEGADAEKVLYCRIALTERLPESSIAKGPSKFESNPH
jgi:hypothetical protein